MDWQQWHVAYDVDGSALADRLLAVQRRLARWLEELGDRPARVISACAGQGRDLIEVLAERPGHRVTARLVELDPDLTARARGRASDAGVDGIEVVTADAGLSAVYAGMTPSDLVLLCGVFGNIGDEDVARTVRALSSLCVPGGTVIWTRHRRAPDATPQIRALFAEAGFEEIAVESPGEGMWSVGAHSLVRPVVAAVPERLFSFS